MVLYDLSEYLKFTNILIINKKLCRH